MTQETRTRQRKRADALFSKLIVTRDGMCQRCGSFGPYLQCAHVIGRARYATRWEPDNAMCLCRGCHLYFTLRPEQWREWIDERVDYDALYQKSLTSFRPDYPLLIAWLKQELAKVEAVAS